MPTEAAVVSAEGSSTSARATYDSPMKTAATRKQTPKASGPGSTASTYAVTKLPAKPPSAPATLAMAKNRPRVRSGTRRPTTSIHAGMSAPPVVLTISIMASDTAMARSGARAASQKATAARTRNGMRSHTVQRRTNGILRASDWVWSAAKSDGSCQPSVITAGNVPTTTFGAPSITAEAVMIVEGDANESRTRNSATAAQGEAT